MGGCCVPKNSISTGRLKDLARGGRRVVSLHGDGECAPAPMISLSLVVSELNTSAAATSAARVSMHDQECLLFGRVGERHKYAVSAQSTIFGPIAPFNVEDVGPVRYMFKCEATAHVGQSLVESARKRLPQLHCRIYHRDFRAMKEVL